MTKRLFSIFLTVAMMISMMAYISVYAADTVLTDNGADGIGWFKVDTDNTDTHNKGTETEYTSQAGTIEESTVQIKDNTGKGGGRALYVKFKSSDWNNEENNSTWDSMKIKNTGMADAFKTGTTYRFSYDINLLCDTPKKSENYMPEFVFGWTFGQNRITPGHNDIQLPAADDDGWRHIEITAIKASESNEWWMDIARNTEFYIDNIVITEVGGDGRNLVENGDFETIMLPDFTETTLDTSANGNFGIEQPNQYNDTHSSYSVMVTAAEASHGNKSLHLKWTSSNSDSNIRIIAKSPEGTGYKSKITSGNKYTLSADVKVVSMTESAYATYGMFWNWNGMNIKNKINDNVLKFNSWGELKETQIWSTDSAQDIRILLQANGTVDMYIDNMKLMDEQGNVLWSESFETMSDGMEVFGTKFYDSNIKQVTKLTEDLSGKTVVATAAVANYDNVDKTAQLLIGIYKNDRFIDCSLSDIETVSAVDNSGALFIQKEITLPEFKSDDNITVKAFLWNSIIGMVPLTSNISTLSM